MRLGLGLRDSVKAYKPSTSIYGKAFLVHNTGCNVENWFFYRFDLGAEKWRNCLFSGESNGLS